MGDDQQSLEVRKNIQLTLEHILEVFYCNVFRYSPKINGNPDELPLRSDEVKFLARFLYSLSLWINTKLPISSWYNRTGLLGEATRQVCEPPVDYRVMRKNGLQPLEASLPARVMLRPLASKKFVSYFFIFLAFTYLFGVGRSAKLVTFAFTIWFVWLIVLTLRTPDEGQPQRRRMTRRNLNDSYN